MWITEKALIALLVVHSARVLICIKIFQNSYLFAYHFYYNAYVLHKIHTMCITDKSLIALLVVHSARVLICIKTFQILITFYSTPIPIALKVLKCYE